MLKARLCRIHPSRFRQPPAGAAESSIRRYASPVAVAAGVHHHRPHHRAEIRAAGATVVAPRVIAAKARTRAVIQTARAATIRTPAAIRITRVAQISGVVGIRVVGTSPGVAMTDAARVAVLLVAPIPAVVAPIPVVIRKAPAAGIPTPAVIRIIRIVACARWLVAMTTIPAVTIRVAAMLHAAKTAVVRQILVVEVKTPVVIRQIPAAGIPTPVVIPIIRIVGAGAAADAKRLVAIASISAVTVRVTTTIPARTIVARAGSARALTHAPGPPPPSDKRVP